MSELRTWKQSFLDHLKERKYAELTQARYGDLVEKLLVWLEVKNVISGKGLSTRLLNDFLDQLCSGKSERTPAAYVTALKSFCLYLCQSGRLSADFCPLLGAPKSEKPVQTVTEFEKACVRQLCSWRVSFLKDLKLRNYSNRTSFSYDRRLESFFTWLDLNEPLVSLSDLSPQVLQNYLLWISLTPCITRARVQNKSRLKSDQTRAGYCTALKSFFRYLYRSQKLMTNPAALLEFPKIRHKIPEHIPTVEQMAGLFEVIPTDSDIGIHDRAVLELFYGSGLRRSELLNLRLQDVDFAARTVRVLGKGNLERVLPLGREAHLALVKYLKQVRPHWVQGDCSNVFISKLHGQRQRGNHLLQRIREYCVEAGLSPLTRFHGFRHAFATHLMQGKADIRAIQALLGHSSLDVTAHYLKVDVSHLREVILENHPRENPDLGWQEVDEKTSK